MPAASIYITHIFADTEAFKREFDVEPLSTQLANTDFHYILYASTNFQLFSRSGFISVV